MAVTAVEADRPKDIQWNIQIYEMPTPLNFALSLCSVNTTGYGRQLTWQK